MIIPLKNKERLALFKMAVSGLLISLAIISCNKKGVNRASNQYGTAFIHVVDSTGSSKSGIELTLQKITQSGYKTLLTEYSDSSGKYIFDKLEFGKYKILLTGVLVFPDSLAFSVSSADTINLTDKLKIFSGKLRLLSYNVREGFDHMDINKVDSFVQWVKKINPDIICYQELSSFTPKFLAELAARYNHPYSVMYQVDNYPVGISSKYPITGVQDLHVKGSVHGCILANILGINVFALHLSPRSLSERIDEMDGLSAEAKSFPSGSYTFFAGDFNSFSEFNANNYGPDWSSDMHEMKPNVEQDFTVTNTLLDMGYKDSYTMFHDTFKRSEPTKAYFQYPDKWKGTRYIYVFLSPELAKHCTSADIWYDETTESLSDHYPMVVDFHF